MWVKRQRNLIFNPWWAFELLLQHLEHEALELDRTNCYSSKTPNYGRILDIMDGSHYCFQGRGVKGGQNS